MNRLKIAFMGNLYSNSHQAAMRFVRKKRLVPFELVPVMNADGVLKALSSKEADFGVIAIKNSRAGKVLESKIALSNYDYKPLSHIKMPIEHYLCTKDKLEIAQIKSVYSHIQAIQQSAKFLKGKNLYKDSLAYIDTAQAAIDLKNGKLKRESAVICSRLAASKYKLHIIADKIQGRAKNITEFILIKLV